MSNLHVQLDTSQATLFLPCELLEALGQNKGFDPCACITREVCRQQR